MRFLKIINYLIFTIIIGILGFLVVHLMLPQKDVKSVQSDDIMAITQESTSIEELAEVFSIEETLEEEFTWEKIEEETTIKENIEPTTTESKNDDSSIEKKDNSYKKDQLYKPPYTFLPQETTEATIESTPEVAIEPTTEATIDEPTTEVAIEPTTEATIDEPTTEVAIEPTATIPTSNNANDNNSNHNDNNSSNNNTDASTESNNNATDTTADSEQDNIDSSTTDTIPDYDGEVSSSISSNSVGAVYQDPSIDKLSGYYKNIFLNDTPDLIDQKLDIIPPSNPEYVTKQYEDFYIIPDKHNTGLKDPAACNIIVKPHETYPQFRGVEFREIDDDRGLQMYLDFGIKANKYLNGELIFENVDFSQYGPYQSGVWNLGHYKGSGLRIIYKNCKFAAWYVRDFETETIPVQFEFENCSFTRVNGCNFIMKNCYVGGGDLDAINPGKNIYCYNSYFSDISHKTKTQGGTHLDGLQSLFCRNLYFSNCRWETPHINYSVHAGGFSYVIYFEPIYDEYPGNNCILDHCYLNGGGYYAISCTVDTTIEDNIRIIKPVIGEAYRSKPCYPSKDGSIGTSEKIVENPRLEKDLTLYVSSVWKDSNNKLHFLVSNDSYQDRTLTVYTNHGKQDFSIKKTYKWNDYEQDSINFSDFPIDIEYVLDCDNPDYAVFYDGNRQIRFVNYTDRKVKKPQ